jgi:hypothetical protein
MGCEMATSSSHLAVDRKISPPPVRSSDYGSGFSSVGCLTMICYDVDHVQWERMQRVGAGYCDLNFVTAEIQMMPS